MDYRFIPIEHNCADKLIPEYLERAAREGDGFLSERLLKCDFYEILANEDVIGFLALNGDVLSGFYVDAYKYALAQSAFDAALKTLKIYSAHIASYDSALIALASTRWTGAQIHAHCFIMGETKKEPPFIGGALKCASSEDFELLMNTGYFPDEVLTELLKNHSIYICFEGGCFKAFGTVIAVKYMEGVADVGAYVAPAFRGEGYGKSMLANMARLCEDYHLKPVAVCGAKNSALEHALKSAGFVSYDKVLRVTFPEQIN